MTLKTKFITFDEIETQSKDCSRIVIFFENGEVFGSDSWRIDSVERLWVYDYSCDEETSVNEVFIEHIMLVYKENDNES